MATIANLCVNLSANSKQLETGFERGKAQANLFALHARQKAAAVGRAFANIPGSKIAGGIVAGASLASTALRSLQSALSSIPIVGGVFAAVPIGLKGMAGVIKENVKEMAAFAKMSARLGVSVEFLSVASMTAGGNVESFEKGLLHLSSMLGQVSQGSEEASRTFTRLGFDAQSLAAAGTEGAITMIGDKLSQMNDAGQRAEVMMKLLTHRGLALAPMLMQGSEGFEQFKKRAQQTGIFLSSLDAAGALRASKAFKEIDLITKGIQRQFAISFAPIVASINESFSEWVKSMGGFRGAFSHIAEGAGVFLATFLTGLDAVIERLDKIINLSEMVTDPKSAILKRLPTGMATGLLLATQGMGAMGAEAAKRSDRPLQRLAANVGNIGKWFTDAASKAKEFGESLPNTRIQEIVEKAGELKEKLGTALETYGKSGNFAELAKLKRDLDSVKIVPKGNLGGLPFGSGFAAAQQAAAKLVEYERQSAKKAFDGAQARVAELDLLDKIGERSTATLTIFDDARNKATQLADAMKAGKISADGLAGGMYKIGDALDKAMSSKAVELFKETRTPLENLKGKLGELDEMLDRGAIGWGIYARAVGKAASEMGEMRKPTMTGSAEFGSQEAYKTINQDALNSSRSDPVARLQQLIQAQTEVQKRSEAELRQIANAVRRGLFKVG